VKDDPQTLFGDAAHDAGLHQIAAQRRERPGGVGLAKLLRAGVDDLDDTGTHLGGDGAWPSAAPRRHERFETDVVEVVDDVSHPVGGAVQGVRDLWCRVTSPAHVDDLRTAHGHR
jgi:hypothetical protein